MQVDLNEDTHIETASRQRNQHPACQSSSYIYVAEHGQHTGPYHAVQLLQGSSNQVKYLWLYVRFW